MRYLSYLGRLLKEFFLFARKQKAYWIVPLVAVLILVAGAVAVGQGAAPFIYTLF